MRRTLEYGKIGFAKSALDTARKDEQSTTVAVSPRTTSSIYNHSYFDNAQKG